MWVMGQLCDGSHGSRVTKDDPFPSLSRPTHVILVSITALCRLDLTPPTTIMATTAMVTERDTNESVTSTKGKWVGGNRY